MNKIVIICSVFLLLACQSSPRAIEYGKDACSYCKMSVVDNRHAAQLVTEKGRNYVFDAIECLVRYHEQETAQAYEYVLVADYLNPGQLVDAKTAHYLISPNIPSPMGAFLSAFSSQEGSVQLQAKKEGTLYSWEELLIEIP